MIVLLRHGQTTWNLEGRVQGREDAPLTELGERQAAAMGAAVARIVGDGRGWRLVASPLGRARRSAEIVAAATGLAVELDDRLVEIGCGAWEGRLYEEIAAEDPDHWRQHWLYGAPGGGERWEDVDARARGWLAEAPPEPARRIVVVSHGVWGRHLRGAYAGLPPAAVARLPVPQDALFELAGGEVRRVDLAVSG